MENTWKYILIGLLAVAFILKRIYASHPFVKKNNPFISISIIFILAVWLAIEFYKTNIYIGIFAIVLALLAIAKVIADIAKKGK